MSYCATMVLKKGDVSDLKKYKNSWGFFAFVWDKLWDKYIEKKHEYDNWLSAGATGDTRLWDLHDDDRLKDYERQVLKMTLDYAAVRFEDLQNAADALWAFLRKYPAMDRVCHLEGIADDLVELSESGSTDVVGVGFYGTSVVENPWYSYDEELDRYTGVDITDPDGPGWFVDFSGDQDESSDS